MSDITDNQWQRIRRHFGDMAYEHPEMHKVMLELLDVKGIDGGARESNKSEALGHRRSSLRAAWPDGA